MSVAAIFWYGCTQTLQTVTPGVLSPLVLYGVAPASGRVALSAESATTLRQFDIMDQAGLVHYGLGARRPVGVTQHRHVLSGG